MHKKIVPAVWFQNKLNPAPASPTKPRVLELMESQLATVAGGLLTADTYTCSNCIQDDSCD
jgi:hypothetical protein